MSRTGPIILSAFIILLCATRATLAQQAVNSWTLLSNYPPGLTTKTSIVLDGKVYILPEANVNEWKTNKGLMDHAYILNDLSSFHWNYSLTTGMAPIVRDDYCAVMIQSKAYVFGGLNENFFSDMSILNLATLSWEKGANESAEGPKARTLPYCFEYQGQPLVFGGLGPMAVYRDMWRFNTTSKLWNRVTTRDPPTTYGGASARFGDSFYIFSGSDMDIIRESLFMLDLNRLTWTELKIVNTIGAAFSGSFRASSSLVGSLLYVFFGQTRSGSQNLVKSYFSIDLQNRTTVFGRTIQESDNQGYPYDVKYPFPRTGSAAVVINSKILLSGGTHGAVDDTIWVYDTSSNSWESSSLRFYPMSRYATSACAMGASDFATFGGFIAKNNKMVLLNDLWSFSRDTRRWTLLFPITAYNKNTLHLYPPGLRRSSIAFYNSSIYLIGGTSDLDSIAEFSYRFALESRSWFKLIPPTKANGIYSSYGQASILIGKNIFLWGGMPNKSQGNESRHFVTIMDLEKMVPFVHSNQSAHLNATFASSSFAYGGLSFCIQGGSSMDFDLELVEPFSEKPAFHQRIQCFRNDSSSWLEFSSQTLPKSLYSSFAYVGSGILTGGIDEKGDAVPRVWIYDFIQKSWGMHPNPWKGPGVLLRPTTIALGSVVVMIFPDVGDGLESRVLAYETGTMFCSGQQSVTFQGAPVILEDGSSQFPYMPSTNCSWDVKNINTLVVKRLELGETSMLQLQVDSKCGDKSIIIPNMDQQTQNGILRNLPSSAVINIPCGNFKLLFESMPSYDNLGGFLLEGLKCPNGYQVRSSRCVCPADHYITPSGECYPCEVGTYQNLVNMRTCLVVGSRALASANYFANATTGDWKYINETLPLCISSSSATYKGIPYFFCMFNGARNRETETVPVAIFKLVQLYNAKWSYEIPSSKLIPPSRRGACTISTSDGIYYISGRAPESKDLHTYLYSPTSKIWSTLPSSPLDVVGQACFLLDNKIILHGGETVHGDVTNRIQIYDIAQKTWEIQEWVQSPTLSFHAGWVYDRTIFVYGGYDGSQEKNILYGGNAAARTWQNFGILAVDGNVDCSKGSYSCLMARQMASTAIVGNRVYIYGGFQRRIIFRQLIVIDARRKAIISLYQYDPESPEVTTAPPASYAGTAAVMDSKIFFYGGYGNQKNIPLNTMWNFDSGVWFGSSQILVPPPRRDFAATKVLDFGFAIFGGYVRSHAEYLSNDAWVFNKRLSQWINVATYDKASGKPEPRSGGGLVFFSNFLYVFGGTDLEYEKNLIWRLDISRVVRQNALEVSTNWQSISLDSSTTATQNAFLRSSFSYILVNGTIWIWGGEITSDREFVDNYRTCFKVNLRQSQLEAYDPPGDSPIPRTGHASAQIRDRLCIHGGEDFRKRILGDLWCFDTVKMNWTRIEDESEGGLVRIMHASSNLGNNLVVHGGKDSAGNPRNDFWLYQFETSSWIELNGKSVGVPILDSYSHSLLTFDEQVIVYGGATQHQSTDQLRVYRPGICNPSLAIEIQSFRTPQQYKDHSGRAKYPSGTHCKWHFKDATHILLDYKLGPVDRVAIFETSSTGIRTLFTSSSPSPKSGEWISASQRGLIVTLYSPDLLTVDATGEFVSVNHIACPTYAKVVNSTCYCQEGFFEEKISNECQKCSSDSPDLACRVFDNESGLSSGQLSGIIGGTVGAILLLAGISYRKYASKVKALADREHQLYAKVDFAELEFGQLLGSGSFGEVFICNWRGSQIAVKKLNYEKMTKAALRDFESEVSVMVQLRHPNVLLYMGAVIQPPRLCILSELMSRGSLYDVLHDESIEINYGLRISFLIDAAKGLQYLHMCSPPIFHKDLKSPNLLLDEKWNLKISTKGKAGSDDPAGTLLWMAPEVILALPYVEASDVYSYAVIMWEVFTRKEPYEGELAEAVVLRVAQDNLRPPMPSAEEMPEELQNLMVRCWDNETQKRPTFQEVLKELKIITGRGSTSNGTGSSRRNTGSHVYQYSTVTTKQDPPVGKVALVFTDVQGSTSMWEAFPQDMSDALVMHNELMRGVIRRNGGYEVKTEGDAFMIAFTSAKKALSFCLQAQETLLAAIWPDAILQHPAAAVEVCRNSIIFRGIRVRMGIHLGEPLCREDPVTGRMDYFGPVVNRAARVGGFPKGGQIAVSEPAYQELISDLESVGNPVVRDLGEYTLKGLNSPDHLYEILPIALADRSLHFMGESGSGSTSSLPNVTDGSGSQVNLTRDNFSWQVEAEELDVSNLELGSGSYGVVFLAKFKGQEVAVKKFAKQKVGEKQYFDLLAEIMLLKELEHPRVLKFLGACLKPPNICMVMEYARHGSLRKILTDQEITLSAADQKMILHQVANGMKYLHQRTPPVFHRDLKSPNILVCEMNPFSIRIADFGLARVKADNQTMTKCGTKGWLAPEVLKGLRYNEKADVYSYGIMIWEIITRQKPYQGVDPLKLNFQVVGGLRPPLPKAGDPLLMDLMQQCWDTEPQIRPSFEQIESTLDANTLLQ